MNLLRTVVTLNDPVVVAEQHSPQLVDLTLNEIIRDGKVTNHYQIFVLSHLSGFFKDGLKSVDLQLENPITYESGATDAQQIAEIKALSDAEHVTLAQYLSDCIVAGESALHDCNSTVTDWMRFVLRKQD